VTPAYHITNFSHHDDGTSSGDGTSSSSDN
jgi:hypothetical protein